MKAYLVFGRLNPPTIGHSKLIEALDDAAKMGGGDAFLFVTHSVNKPADYKRAAKAETPEGVAKELRNPLTWDQKMDFISRIYGSMFPDVILVDDDSIRSLNQALSFLHEKGYTEATIVAGSDRVPEFDYFLERYAADEKTPDFEVLDTTSAGERDPDSEGVEGMSGTKLRTIALEGDRDAFASAIDTGDEQLIDELFEAVTEGLEIPEKYQPAVEPVMAESFVPADKLDNLEERTGVPEIDFQALVKFLRVDCGYRLTSDEINEIQEIMKEKYLDDTKTATLIAHVIHARPVDVLNALQHVI